MTDLKELKHSLLEPGCINFLGPFVFPYGIPVTTYLHRFLRIWSLGTESCYLSCIRGLRDAFPTDFDIASIGTRVVPRDLGLRSPLNSVIV
jgi:hypothetical protein